MHDMVRTFLLALAVSATLGLAACSGPPRRLRADDRPGGGEPEAAPTAEVVAERVARVVGLHNEERAKEKLNSLEVSPKLTKAAQRQADDMAKHKEMRHKGSDGTSPFDRIKAAGYRYRRAGENVAFGRYAPEKLMKGWMDSPGHRKNILGSYSQIGVACAIAEDGTSYWCATFGMPLR
jgi:uncharacterized protein YkwD